MKIHALENPPTSDPDKIRILRLPQIQFRAADAATISRAAPRHREMTFREDFTQEHSLRGSPVNPTEISGIL